MRVAVLTTSYPRDEDDPAGRFVADAVERARARGVAVEVVSPATVRHFGVAYGHGIVGNIRARPLPALMLPAFLFNLRRAVPRDVDLVHAHWLGAGLVASTLRIPYVVQVWGTDVALARRAPAFARWILRRAQLVIAASPFLAGEARALGAHDVWIVPTGVEIPDTVGEPEQPPHVLYVGRLSPEKGIEEFLAATESLPRVIVGGGPVSVPESVGFVPPRELGPYYERAAVVCCPSRREGYGVVAREAMAHARPVVATPVGGLADAIDDGVNGILTPDVRPAIERLLQVADERARLGAAAREKAIREWSWNAATDALLAVYDEVIRDSRRVNSARST